MEGSDEGAILCATVLLRDRSPLRIPAAAWVEFLGGVPPKRRSAVEENLLRAATFVPFGKEEADAAVPLHHALVAAGKPLSWHDLQIAATALHQGESLVSNDQAFRRIPGLKVITF